MSESCKKSVVVEKVTHLRVDRYIAEYLGLFSRSQLRLRNVRVSVNGAAAKLSRHVSSGDRLTITYSELEAPSFAPEKMELDILFENAHVVVLNKSQGRVVHPAAGNHSGTLIQGLLYHNRAIKGAFSPEDVRPGIVHRLDKDTSGVLIAAKNPEVQAYLSNQFRLRQTKKKYFAVVKGNFAIVHGTLNTYIKRDRRQRKKFTVDGSSGKAAETHYQVLKQWKGYAFVSLRPVTGRTHQLRVHMAHIGHPILGDLTYGGKDRTFPDVTLLLHAYALTIRLPPEGKEVSFRAKLPVRFKEMLLTLAKMPDY